MLLAPSHALTHTSIQAANVPTGVDRGHFCFEGDVFLSVILTLRSRIVSVIMVSFIEMNFNFFPVSLMELEVHLDSPILHPVQVQKLMIKHAVAGAARWGTHTGVSAGSDSFLLLLFLCPLPVIPGKGDFFLTALHVSQKSGSDTYQLTRCSGETLISAPVNSLF